MVSRILMGRFLIRYHSLALLFSAIMALGLGSCQRKAALAPDYLGNGLVEIAVPFELPPTPLYRDSISGSVLTVLTLQQTNCPECMSCAEPDRFHTGTILPFLCGSGRLSFICTGTGSNRYQIRIDSIGQVAYLSKTAGTFYTWNDYFRKQAAQGEFFSFDRAYDTTILYDKPYERAALPKADRTFRVHLQYEESEFLRFYPVQVKGYWMQLKIMEDTATIGYCWMIWRDEKHWLKGFQFNPE